MSMILCDKGHWYDGSLYRACPYCETQSTARLPAPGPRTGDEPRTEGMDVSYARPPRRVPLSLVPSRLPEPWDDCRVTDRLGSGGVGTVFRIRRTVDYALKVIPWTAEGAREAALREYETARRLSDCENILRYLDYAEADSSSLLVLELAEPWMDRAARRGSTAGEALDAVLQLCRALSAMEAAGILHMDVNPRNIFLSDGRVKLGDFSHARPAAPGEKHACPTGTLPFMAPEVADGGACSGREDIYSLGVTMFLLLTGGRYPFHPEGGEPGPRRETDRITTLFLDGELKRIVEKAAAFAPEDRYARAADMAEDVAAFLSAHSEAMGEPIPFPPVRAGDRPDERTVGSVTADSGRTLFPRGTE